MEFFLQLLVIGLSIGFLYALAALGFVMIFKSSSVLNFAHGELLAIGAFGFLALAVWAKLPILLVFLITLLGSFALGFIIERLFLRPLIGEALIQVIMQYVHINYLFHLTTIFHGFVPCKLSLCLCPRLFLRIPSGQGAAGFYKSCNQCCHTNTNFSFAHFR